MLCACREGLQQQEVGCASAVNDLILQKWQTRPGTDLTFPEVVSQAMPSSHISVCSCCSSADERYNKVHHWFLLYLVSCVIMPFRFADDQTFSSLQATDLKTMDVVDGTWYVYLKGDYAGRVSGAVYDYRNSSDPVKLVTTVSLRPKQHHHQHQHLCQCCNIMHLAVVRFGCESVLP